MRLRNGIFLGAGLSLLAASAMAQDIGYGAAYSANGDNHLPAFAGLRGSITMGRSADTSISSGGTIIPLRGSFKTGGGGSIYAGVRLPLGLRAEVEGLYRYLPIKNLSIGGVTTAANGQAHLGGPMFNLMWDVPVSGIPIKPYIGLGVGGLYTDVSAKSSGAKIIDGNTWNLAYEVIAGAQIPLGQNSRLTANYRWLQVDQARLNCTVAPLATQNCKANLNTQSIDLGLEFDL